MDADLIDTDIATYILQGRPEAVEFLAGLQAKQCRIFFSEVTRAELLSTPGLSEAQSQEIEALMGCATAVIEVDAEIARLAGELRRNHNAGTRKACSACGRRSGGKLRLPDAIVAATAISEDATLATNNEHDYAGLVQAGVLRVFNPMQAQQVSRP